jgi:serpin B
MSSSFCRWSCLVMTLVPGFRLLANEPFLAKEGFLPNYIAIEDVSLQSADGKPLDTLKVGTQVAAQAQPDGLAIVTIDGKKGVAAARSFSRLGGSIPVTDDARKVAESSNQFAFKLYQQTRQKAGNLFFSPGSISTALAMTYAGARGTTQQEMAQVLHLSRDEQTDEGFSTLLALLNSTGNANGYSISTANRLWGAANYEFEPVFLDLTRDKYQAELQTVDYGDPVAARKTINTWVEDQTRHKIKDLIGDGVLNQDTRLVLTNAICFAGSWSSEFPQDATKKAPFHLVSNSPFEALTMELTGKSFPYAHDAEVQVVMLPYRGNELSMVVVLPKTNKGLAKIEASLTAERFAGWIRQFRGVLPVDVYLPKFKMRSELTLSQALKAMGMSRAFSSGADFSGMSKNETLMISDVIHQAYVDVDEKGTEAAAATAAMISVASARPLQKEPPKPVIFRADHPFLFVIRDNRTGMVLFLGRVERPEA